MTALVRSHPVRNQVKPADVRLVWVPMQEMNGWGPVIWRVSGRNEKTALSRRDAVPGCTNDVGTVCGQIRSKSSEGCMVFRVSSRIAGSRTRKCGFGAIAATLWGWLGYWLQHGLSLNAPTLWGGRFLSAKTQERLGGGRWRLRMRRAAMRTSTSLLTRLDMEVCQMQRET